MSEKKYLFEIPVIVSSSIECCGLWNVISSKFSFNKINFNKTSDTDDANGINIYNSQYSYTPKNNISNEIIIYQNNECKIVSNKYWEYGYMFAVQDGSQSNRYFIGFTYSGNVYIDNICGMIVYFDSTGKIGEKTIIDRIVCKYDLSNGRINTSRAIFYKQCLLFYQVHKDTCELILFVNLLSNVDRLCYKSHEHTRIKTNWILLDKTKHENQRFLHVTEVLEEKNWSPVKTTNVLIDLDSLKFVENYISLSSNFKSNSKSYLLMDYYKIDLAADIDKCMVEITKVNIDDSSFDGYPIKCAKCLSLTKTAMYKTNHILMGLGDSFCIDCNIRYSKSENSWICCKLSNKVDSCENIFSTNICSCKLEPGENYVCKEQHNHSVKFNLKINCTDKTYRYPYKDVISINSELN